MGNPDQDHPSPPHRKCTCRMAPASVVRKSVYVQHTMIVEEKLSNKACLGGAWDLEVQGGEGEMCVAFDIW